MGLPSQRAGTASTASLTDTPVRIKGYRYLGVVIHDVGAQMVTAGR